MMKSRSNSVSSEEAPSSPESMIDVSPQPSPSPHSDSAFEEEPPYSPASESSYSPAYRPDDKEDKFSSPRHHHHNKHYDNEYNQQHSPQPIHDYETDDDTFGSQDDFVSAVRNGDPRNLKHILTRYSELIQINRMTKDGQTALTQSCLDGNIEVVKVLIDHGANPDLTNRDGFSPIHVACHVGKMDLVRYFLSANSNNSR